MCVRLCEIEKGKENRGSKEKKHQTTKSIRAMIRASFEGESDERHEERREEREEPPSLILRVFFQGRWNSHIGFINKYIGNWLAAVMDG